MYQRIKGERAKVSRELQWNQPKGSRRVSLHHPPFFLDTDQEFAVKFLESKGRREMIVSRSGAFYNVEINSLLRSTKLLKNFYRC